MFHPLVLRGLDPAVRERVVELFEDCLEVRLGDMGLLDEVGLERAVRGGLKLVEDGFIEGWWSAGLGAGGPDVRFWVSVEVPVLDVDCVRVRVEPDLAAEGSVSARELVEARRFWLRFARAVVEAMLVAYYNVVGAWRPCDVVLLARHGRLAFLAARRWRMPRLPNMVPISRFSAALVRIDHRGCRIRAGLLWKTGFTGPDSMLAERWMFSELEGDRSPYGELVSALREFEDRYAVVAVGPFFPPVEVPARLVADARLRELRCWRCGSRLLTYERVYEPRDMLGSEDYPLVRAVRCPRCLLDLPYDYAWLVNYSVASYRSVVNLLRA